MTVKNPVVFSQKQKGIFLLLGILLVLFLTLAAAIRFYTPLNGMPDTELKRLDSNWFYEDGSSQLPLEQLPCSLHSTADTLYLVHSLSDVSCLPEEVLTFQTRYQSIRVWADDQLIYEAAQGKEHALSSMWHFIPAKECQGSSWLRVELVKYDQNPEWDLFSVFLDHPDSILVHIFRMHMPTILVWACCTLFTLLLVCVIVFMAIQKIAGISSILALASFIFLSGTWILLDSKITTLGGGNYALTYFLSYCAFYLLPVPLFQYFRLMLGRKSRFLWYLSWITAANAAVWMLLHLMGIVSIRNTAFTVHILILLFVFVSIADLVHNIKKQRSKRLACTFWGTIFIFVSAVISIILYCAGLLPPTNSAVLYAWTLLILILCMIMDAVFMFGRLWTEKQYINRYRQLAVEDSMTSLGNRNAYELRLQKIVSDPPDELSFIFFDIDNMKEINDTYGHHVGDQVIFLTAECIQEVFGHSKNCYRIGGDEFCVLLTSSKDISKQLQRFDKLIQTRNVNPFPVSVSYGWEKRFFEAGKAVTIEDIIELKVASDKNLYRQKKGK